MTDIPIIFSAPMILALLAGRKTMTRRLAWRDKWIGPPAYRSSPWQRVKPGDRLWCRESAWFDREVIPAVGASRCFFEGGSVRFSDGRFGQAPGHPDSSCAEVFRLNGSLKMRPSIHMPRWASRLTLIVTATKVEPLKYITEADSWAEGIEYRDGCYGTWNADGTMRCGGSDNAREAFRCLWINLHGTGAWDETPEVVALTFRVIKANIDEVSPPHKTHTAALAGAI